MQQNILPGYISASGNNLTKSKSEGKTNVFLQTVGGLGCMKGVRGFGLIATDSEDSLQPFSQKWYDVTKNCEDVV